MLNNFPNLEVQWTGIKPDLAEEFQGVAVSLSGGPDSTALLRLFSDFTKRKKNFQVRAFHLNFGLRGGDSDGDETFCRTLCSDLNIPLEVRRVSKSENDANSIQEWARDERLKIQREFLREGWIIATGHQLDDLAETVIFRLIRGFSASQLPGMQLWNGTHWRPFLETPKNEILDYLSSLQQDFRIDASNEKTDYTRNKIRHGILPLLEQIAPNARRNICEVAQEAAAIGKELLKSMPSATKPVVSAVKLRQMDRLAARYIVKSLLYRLMGGTGKPTEHIKLSRHLLDKIVMHCCTDSVEEVVFDISTELKVSIEAGRFSITKKKPDIKSKRFLQFAQQLQPLDSSCLIGSGSHGFFRDGEAIWSIRPTGKTKGHSLEFKLQNARSGDKIKLAAWKTGRSVKNMFQELSVTPDKRSKCRIILKNGEQVSLFDGERIINPANLAMQATIEGINFIITKKA